MKLPKLTNVNAAGLAKLYNVEGKLIGRCMDTPNAIGCVLGSNLGVALVIGTFGEIRTSDKDTIKNKGWMTLKTAMFVKKV